MHAHLRPLFLSICTLIAAPTVLFAQQKIDFPSKGIASTPPAGATADGVPAVVVFPDMPSKIVAIYRGPGFFSQELAARFEVTKDSQAPAQAPMAIPAKAVVLDPPADLPRRAAVLPAMPEIPKSTTTQFVPPPAMPSLPPASAGAVEAPSTPTPAVLAIAPQSVLPTATPPPPQASPPARPPSADPFMVPATASRPVPAFPGAGSVPTTTDEAAGFVPPPAVVPSPLAPPAPAAVKSGRTTTPLVPINIPPRS